MVIKLAFKEKRDRDSRTLGAGSCMRTLYTVTYLGKFGHNVGGKHTSAKTNNQDIGFRLSAHSPNHESVILLAQVVEV